MDERKKSKNFSLAEEEQLMNLVSKYWSIIQCKTTNHINNMKKKEQWSKIESEFNSVIYEQYRPAHVLKCKFENICRQAQKKKFENIKQLKYTGGGKANLAKYVSADKRFLDLLGRRSSELNSKWCDDEVKNTENSKEYDIEEVLCDAIIEETTDDNNKQVINSNECAESGTSWAKCTPGMLKTKKSVPLCFTQTKNNDELPASGQLKRRKLFQNNLTLWAKEKASITEQEASFQREEIEAKRELWRLKLEQEQELSDLLKQEVKDRIKFQAEKHCAEMELLALQKSKMLL